MRFHAVRLFKPKGLSPSLNVEIHAGGEISVGGDVEKNRALTIWLDAIGDIEIDASMQSRFLRVSSESGSVLFRPKGKFQSQLGGDVRLVAGGDVVLEDRVSIRGSGIEVHAGGDLTMTAPKVKSASYLELEAASIRSFGKAKLSAKKYFTVPGCPVTIASGAGGSIWLDQLVLRGAGAICVTGGSLRIGDDRRRSKITVKPNDGDPQELVIGVDGAVDLDRVSIVSPAVAITTRGTDVRITGGTLKGAPAGTTTLTTGAGSTCDLTGTVFKSMTLVENCGSLVGP